MKKNGFSLIELLVVISIIGVVFTAGIVSFVSYGRKQAVNSATLDVVTNLNIAKSQARNQVKPSECNNNIFQGYQVYIDDSNTYVLSAMCGGSSYATKTYKISPDSAKKITFSPPSLAKTFLFRPLSGVVAFNTTSGNQSTIVVSGYGQTRTITIYDNGNITID